MTVSDWLELDASDDWVRHDAEIVPHPTNYHVTAAHLLPPQALKQELAYASYLDVHCAILPPPRHREHVGSYARSVNACLKSTPFINLSIRLPIYDPSIFHAGPSSTNSRFSVSSKGNSHSASAPFLLVPGKNPTSVRSPDGDLNATWEMWDVIRSICDYNPRLSLSETLSTPPSSLSFYL